MQVVQKIERGSYELPRFFVEYVEDKIRRGKKRGRPHIVKRLGSMANVLEVLNEVWLEDKAINEIADDIGIARITLWRLTKDLEPFKDQIIDYLKYVEGFIPRAFDSYQIVQEWERKIRRSGHLSALDHLRVMERICNGDLVKAFRCSPIKFDLDRAQQFVDAYLQSNPQQSKVPRYYRIAMRHFLMVAKGINIPRGFGSQYGLSGEKDAIGQYADIRLTEAQRKIIRAYLQTDQESYAKGYDIVFGIALESPHRAFALGSIPLSSIDLEHGTFKAFEPKTKRGDQFLGIEGTWFDAFILTDKALIDRLRGFMEEYKDRALLFIEGEPTRKKVRRFLMGQYSHGKMVQKGFTYYLKEAYERAGITEAYFYKKPIHALRHDGAQRLLDLTNWDYDLVAELGGWLNTDTLKKWYGKMPPSIRANKLSKIRTIGVKL